LTEERARNRTKSKVRAKVEPAFVVSKRIFGWAKARDRGLVKNAHWQLTGCSLSNLYVARRYRLADI
jgi:IS5 family transposase